MQKQSVYFSCFHVTRDFHETISKEIKMVLSRGVQSVGLERSQMNFSTSSAPDFLGWEEARAKAANIKSEV
jgi:hypothetical protein